MSRQVVKLAVRGIGPVCGAVRVVGWVVAACPVEDVDGTERVAVAWTTSARRESARQTMRGVTTVEGATVKRGAVVARRVCHRTNRCRLWLAGRESLSPKTRLSYSYPQMTSVSVLGVTYEQVRGNLVREEPGSLATTPSPSDQDTNSELEPRL